MKRPGRNFKNVDIMFGWSNGGGYEDVSKEIEDLISLGMRKGWWAF